MIKTKNQVLPSIWHCLVWGMILSFSLGSTPSLSAAATHTEQALKVPSQGRDGFTLLDPRQTGVRFGNRLSDREAAINQIRLNGSGVALGDVDGDGLVDIYLCRLQGSNALYKNLGGWKFRYASQGAPILCSDQYSTGATLADVDGDQDLDLLVNGIGTGTRLFINDGRGQFTEAADTGLARKGGPTTSTLADIDGDGDLDLYVTRYRTTTIRTTGFAILRVGEKRMIRPQDRDHLEITDEGRVLEHGEADSLYLNQGDGSFEEVAWRDGRFKGSNGLPLKKAPFDWGLAAMFRDIDQDGDPDLYVCNDFHSEDRIWINDGTGHFQAAPPLALRHTSTFSMAVDFADINRDGFDDFFVADMLSRRHERRMMQLAAMDPYQSQIGVVDDRPQFDRNTLQLNRGDGTYADIAEYAGIAASEWTWSACFMDVDLDGFEDLLCSTGHLFDTQDMDAEKRIRDKGPWPQHLIPRKLLMFPKMSQPKLAFRNSGNLAFDEVGSQWGFNQKGVAHGMALGDLDNDGDLDLVANNLNAAVGLYRNNSNKPRILVSLKGQGKNTVGIGARVTLVNGDQRQAQEVAAGGRYLSSDLAARMFAASDLQASARLEVRWANGRRSTIPRVKANHRYLIHESASVAPPPANQEYISPWFEDVSHLLSHQHVEKPYSDFEREPMLSRAWSRQGPGLAWFDVDGGGQDDLIIGTGRGGKRAVFMNQGTRFELSPTWSESRPSRRDQTGIVGFVGPRGRRQLLVGLSNFEDGSPQGGSLSHVFAQNAETEGSGQHSGPVALADINGDGYLDGFLGGQGSPGSFPRSDASTIWIGSSKGLAPDSAASNSVAKLSLVRGAVFGDFNGDAAPDLITVSDWGGVHLLINRAGTLTDETESWQLQTYLGWWNGVTTGDFDGDGQLDFVATNWGENHSLGRFKREKERKGEGDHIALFRDDFDGDGQADLVQAVYDATRRAYYPVRHFADLARDLSFLPAKFPELKDYNGATLSAIIGTDFKQSLFRRVHWFSNTVFLNRGDHFQALRLPNEAQWSPAFGVAVGDVNLDGHEDVFLAQNFFGEQPFDSRKDAGRGLWLRGRGDGQFDPVSGTQSGVKIYGEQRGVALADFNGDAKLDFAVAQNGNQSKLFRNRVDKRGLRIVLLGPEKNRMAVGAQTRVKYAGSWGAVAEVRAGGGYWSQDSAVRVVAREGAETVRVRWPDGQISESPIEENCREIWITRDGTSTCFPE